MRIGGRHLVLAFALLASQAHAQFVPYAPGVALDPSGKDAMWPAPEADPGVKLAQIAPSAQGAFDRAASIAVEPLPSAPPAPQIASDPLMVRLAALEKGLDDLKQAVGVPPSKIPASFWDKPVGVALSCAFTAATLAISAAGSYATVAAVGK